jgi:hypothetical protein
MTQPKRQPKKPPANGRRKAAKKKAEQEPQPTVPTHIVHTYVRRARAR